MFGNFGFPKSLSFYPIIRPSFTRESCAEVCSIVLPANLLLIAHPADYDMADRAETRTQSRIWCFTKQAEEESERVAWPLATEANLPLENPDPDKIQGLFYQVERAPTTGQLHLQGFVVFKKKVRFTTVKNLFPGAHLEKARGTQEQNIEYCSKSASKVCGPFKVGVLETPGKSKPLDECCKALAEGKSMYDLADSYPKQIVLHHRGLEALLRYKIRPAPAWRNVTTTWYWGKTEVGKTRRCFVESPDLYRVIDNGQWWDGYTNQSAILFDEFYGDIKCKTMLTWLDGYPIRLPIKGGFVDAHWTQIYITSNVDPQEVYKGVPQDVRDAFFRRITRIEYIEK